MAGASHFNPLSRTSQKRSPHSTISETTNYNVKEKEIQFNAT